MDIEILENTKLLLKKDITDGIPVEQIRLLLSSGRLHSLKFAAELIGRYNEVDLLCCQLSVIATLARNGVTPKVSSLVESALELVENLLGQQIVEDDFYLPELDG